MGYFGASSDVSGVRYWSLQVGSTVYPSTIPVTVGQAAFLVVKISFNAASTDVNLFVNPSSLGIAGEPVVANVSQTTSTLIRIRSTAIYLGSTAGRGAADELRFSESYAVAAPDNTVTLDLPPTGRFSMSQTTGTAPLSINFDATTSSDPEGNPLTYLWNFGDGSTPVLGAATISHTYPAGLSGLIPVTLTVSDLSGQQHSPVQVLTLYVLGTSYIPCQSSITSLQEASCNNDNARVNCGFASIYFSKCVECQYAVHQWK
jgi:PKD repeat protein